MSSATTPELAHHEAGHAVIAYALGARISSVTIVSDGQIGWAGLHRGGGMHFVPDAFSTPHRPPSVPRDWAPLAILAAGAAAPQAWLRAPKWLGDWAAADDYDRCDQHIERLLGYEPTTDAAERIERTFLLSEVWELASVWACRFLSLDPVSEVGEHIALALLDCGTLSGPVVESLCAKLDDPSIAAAAWPTTTEARQIAAILWPPTPRQISDAARKCARDIADLAARKQAEAPQ
jgi:hypothetical protein